MYYGNIKPCSIENGVGVRVSLFVSGCRNACRNCFSQHTWDFRYGEEFTKEVEEALIRELSPDYVNGLTVLGGEPMEPENQKDLLPLLQHVREVLPKKTIWMYTGFVLEKRPDGEGFWLRDTEKTGDMAMRANTKELPEILKCLDVLVDGRFEEEKKNLMIRFRGSENQQIYDMPKTLKTGELTVIEEYMDHRGR